MTPEGKVKAAAKKVLSDAQAWHYMPVQNGMGRVGIPDLIACVPITITPNMVGKRVGVFVAVETKAPGKDKNTTPNQKRNLEGIHEAGGMAVATSDSDLVREALNVLRLTGVPMFFVP